jgi:hypothetical protein
MTKSTLLPSTPLSTYCLVNAMMNIDQMRAVRAILLRDDTSTAAELVYYFVHELGVAPGEAWRAVYRRPPIPRAAHSARELNNWNAEVRQRFL